MLSRHDIEKRISDCCSGLYTSAKHLLDERANERDIAGRLAESLRPFFPGFDVDVEYNREGKIGNRVPKTDNDGNLLLPDIVVHQHGPLGDNLVAIEVKGHWNKEPREIDEDKLRRLRAKHGYQYLYRLELGREQATLIPVE